MTLIFCLVSVSTAAEKHVNYHAVQFICLSHTLRGRNTC